MKTVFKMILGILALIVLFVVGVIIFTKTAPQFGATITEKKAAELSRSPNYDGKTFQNLVETNMDMGLKEIPDLLWAYSQTKNTTPKTKIPTQWEGGVKGDTSIYATWYGHSAILLEMTGKKIFFDPMLGGASSPVSFLTKRFPYESPIPISELPALDAVIISHDHYDHLDYTTILQIKDKTKHFYTGLGVGEHLKKWGVPASKVTEMDWYESADFEELEIIATPARHFSGRSFTDRNATQWASWIVKSAENAIYFSGDSGYSPHFKEIGEKYGPFDLAFVECGQYNQRWGNIHMFPEQTVQAGLDVGAKVAMPIHWGAFNLALHDWRDSITRAIKAANDKPIDMIYPVVGYRFDVKGDLPQKVWWPEMTD